MNIFFYGLFMDKKVLSEKGIAYESYKLGFVEGFGLRIGQRATLVRDQGNRAFGVVMDISSSQFADLYGDQSVANYVPEIEVVQLLDGSQLTATCYNLPGKQVAGTNLEYAAMLLEVAINLGFPDNYLEQLRHPVVCSPGFGNGN